MKKHKLNDEQVMEIKDLYFNGNFNMINLKHIFKVSETTIYNIINNKYKKEKTKMKNKFKFKELSEEAKQRAILHEQSLLNAGGFNNDDIYDDIIIEWELKLEKLGYKEATIFFNGFGSQGDGACFTGTVDILKYIKKHKLSTTCYQILKYLEKYYAFIKLVHHSHYYHSLSTEIAEELPEVGYYNEDLEDFQRTILTIAKEDLETQWQKLLDYIKKEREEIGDKIYKELEEEYYYQYEDENIIANIEAHDQYFDEEGHII